ncbi:MULTISPECIES: DUF2508 family protein [Romboutsia]|uniref:DUF2508 family protein n=1 Tax=Romboutsia ilealis TaxID=1115758 RepID=A0A1V1I468_9FIRM|nr:MULTISPECIES: DUF2508 family protein [Romboutsia]MCI9260843.1 DUF2508 family protein [Romboutsia sp.]CED95042.1 Protein of unknown function (DUF2508) [Romboutsia ilealis]
MSAKKKIEKELEKENIIKEIKKAQADVITAEKFFQLVSEPELVDVAIYNLEAKKSRYRYLIKIAKEKGIKKSLKESLIEAIAK